MTINAIETHGLTRYFGKRAVVHSLEMTVPIGCVYGFLGRNGAGKTTTIRMLLGLDTPTRGTSTVLGHDSRTLSPAVRARIGYMSESHPVYGWMRVREHGQFQSAGYPHWRQDLFESVLSHFRIDPTTKAKDLSRGERAGLCLAMTLAPDPDLLILDDPTLGLDPVVRRSFIESIIYLTRRAGRTVFFSSHHMADVERVADRIGIFDRGGLRADCTIETFRSKLRRVRLRYAAEPATMPNVPGLLCSQRFGNDVLIDLVDIDGSEAALSALPVERLNEPLTLEDAFISYVSARGANSSFFDGMGSAA